APDTLGFTASDSAWIGNLSSSQGVYIEMRSDDDSPTPAFRKFEFSWQRNRYGELLPLLDREILLALEKDSKTLYSIGLRQITQGKDIREFNPMKIKLDVHFKGERIVDYHILPSLQWLFIRSSSGRLLAVTRDKRVNVIAEGLANVTDWGFAGNNRILYAISGHRLRLFA
ncbi:MAG: hypothetical protein HQL31_06895, partial [Planctomycetes bacterium]|nr:hypothetical protein [Planctomycetota bacterium]